MILVLPNQKNKIAPSTLTLKKKLVMDGHGHSMRKH